MATQTQQRTGEMPVGSEALDALGRRVGRRARGVGGRMAALHREVGQTGTPKSAKTGKGDMAQKPTGELLANFWEFVRRPFSAAAAALVTIVGAVGLTGNITGALAQDVEMATALHKARGRNIAPEEVASDLDITVPNGYTPTFDLYLMAAGIRPDATSDRQAANAIKTAIKRKIKEVRAGPSPGDTQ